MGTFPDEVEVLIVVNIKIQMDPYLKFLMSSLDCNQVTLWSWLRLKEKKMEVDR